MKLVKENLNEFKKGLDPIDSLGLSRRAKIEKWFRDLKVYPNMYKIDDDLNIIVNGGLYFYNEKQLTELPDNLYVNGSLNLGRTSITKLPNNLNVRGSLDLSKTRIISLPDNLSIEGSLDLYDTPLSILPKNLYVSGYLDIRDTLIKKLPKTLKVNGFIYKDF